MIQGSSEQEMITLTLLIGSSLSVIGCLFIIFFYFYLKLDIFAFKLVLYMAIADLIHSVCLMLPITEPWCHIQGFLLQFSGLSSIIWTALMAYSLYESVIGLNSNIQGKEKWYLIIGFLVPFGISCLPEISQAYGYSQGWCWIVDHEYSFVYRILCFYLILVIVFVYNCVVYWLVWKKLYKEVLVDLHDEEINKINKDLVTRLKMYPIVLLLSYAGVTSKRMFEIYDVKGEVFWLSLIAGALMSLVGILDAIVYGFSIEVRQSIRMCCRRQKYNESLYEVIN